MAGVRMRRADEVEMVDEHTMRERVIEPLRDHEPTAEEAREALKRRRPGSVQPTMAGVRAINEARALQSQDPVEQIVDAARRLALAKKVAAQTAAGAKTMDELEAEQAPWGVKEEE